MIANLFKSIRSLVKTKPIPKKNPISNPMKIFDHVNYYDKSITQNQDITNMANLFRDIDYSKGAKKINSDKFNELTFKLKKKKNLLKEDLENEYSKILFENNSFNSLKSPKIPEKELFNEYQKKLKTFNQKSFEKKEFNKSIEKKKLEGAKKLKEFQDTENEIEKEIRRIFNQKPLEKKTLEKSKKIEKFLNTEKEIEEEIKGIKNLDRYQKKLKTFNKKLLEKKKLENKEQELKELSKAGLELAKERAKHLIQLSTSERAFKKISDIILSDKESEESIAESISDESLIEIYSDIIDNPLFEE